MRDRPVRGASHVAGCTGLSRPPSAVAGQDEQSDLGRLLRSRNQPAAGPGSRSDYGGLGVRPRSGECRGALEGQVPPTVPPSLPFPRFYKLHERKCEPIVMTVPRKVRPPGALPTHSLPQRTGHAVGTGLRPLNGMWLSVDVVSGLDGYQHAFGSLPGIGPCQA